MTKARYLATLKRLGLTPAAQATAHALGTSVRNIQRYSAGNDVPRTVQLLLRAYTEHPRLLKAVLAELDE